MAIRNIQNFPGGFCIFLLTLGLALNCALANFAWQPDVRIRDTTKVQSRPQSLANFTRNGLGFSELVNSRALLDPEIINGIFFNVSTECKAHGLLWIEEITSWLGPPESQRIPDTWALQMIDSFGKFPDGILSGHTISFGDFTECLQVRGRNSSRGDSEILFKGRYCTTVIVPNLEAAKSKKNLTAAGLRSSLNLSLRDSVSLEQLLELLQDPYGFNLWPLVGVCFPSSCSQSDSQWILWNSYYLLMDSILEQSVIACYTDDKPPLNSAAISMIVILCLIGLFCIVGTAVDVLHYQKLAAESQKNAGKGLKAVIAFSWIANTKKWLNTKTGGSDLSCLHGIRFLSMSWVLLGHTFEHTTIVWNMVDLKTAYNMDWSKYVVLNETVSVDTFFLLSGTLVAFSIFRALDASRGKLNVPLLYFHRFCRLTPLYMVVVGLMATLLPYAGSGPFWYLNENDSAYCVKNWWHSLLYITTLMKYKGGDDNPCVSVSWYISNDFLFFLVAPFIVYPIWKWPKAGLGFLVALMVASIVNPAVTAANKHYPPTYIPFVKQGNYWNDMYDPPWTRIGPYLVGILLGCILYKRAKRRSSLRIPRWIVLLGWLISTGTALAIIFGVRSYFNPAHEHTKASDVASAIYAGLHRFTWGVLIAWIVFVCVNGNGGWVNGLLSWKAFIPLGRLTFCVYMISYHLQGIYHRSQLSPTNFSIYNTVYIFFAHLVMSLLIGYILTIAVESPFLQLEKLVFPQSGAKPSPRKSPEISENGNSNNNQTEIRVEPSTTTSSIQ